MTTAYPRTEPDITYSVITACWNSARTISRCIGSVLGQAILPKEYLFVDGGSTDNTREIVRQSFTDHSGGCSSVPWKILEQGNVRGISAAWNVALKECTGDVVFILNSDDWYESNCAEHILSAMRDNPEAGIVHADARKYKRGETTSCGVWRNRPEWLLPVLMPHVHPACFVRGTVYQRIGGFNPAYAIAMDYDFLWRCKVDGIRSVRLSLILTNFELGGTADSRRREARIELYKIAKQYHRALPAFAFAARYLTGR
jgi:glycosyltransferase involved in cell wall biosynthesis